MKTNMIRRSLLALTVGLMSTATAFAQNSANAAWVRADAYPSDGGLVYVNWYLDGDEILENEWSEFKRAVNIGASTAFITVLPNDGWQLAGYARDTNKNQQYDNGDDAQVFVRPDGFFTAKIDPTEYMGDGSSSSSAELEAKAALEEMENPTDQIYAVFTQGDVARQAEGEEWLGKVWSSKLYNEVGDQVTFSANGDYVSGDSHGVTFFKFDHWTDPMGEILTDRTITVTVTGGGVYTAHFVQTTRDDFNENERKDRILTGIADVRQQNIATGTTYDLSGRRVDVPTAKGVYLRQGKKIVKK